MDKATLVERLRRGLSEMWNTELSWNEVHDELFRIEIGMQPKNEILNRAIRKILS